MPIPSQLAGASYEVGGGREDLNEERQQGSCDNRSRHVEKGRRQRRVCSAED